MFHSRFHTFQGGMEQKAASSHNQVSDEGDEKDAIMTMLDTVVNSSEREPYE